MLLARISIKTAFIIFFVFFLIGFLIGLALIFFFKIKLNQIDIEKKEKIEEQTNGVDKISQPTLDKEIITQEYPIEPIETNRESMEIVSDRKIDYSQIRSKYLEMLERQQSPIFKNYLHKSKRPFLGYVSRSNTACDTSIRSLSWTTNDEICYHQNK